MFEDALRPVIVAAHPDDETIGLGGQLLHLKNLRIIHVTDGAPGNGRDAAGRGFRSRDDYALARRMELIQALAIAGIGPDGATCLGFVDQDASLHLVEVVRALRKIFDETAADIVFTHPYEGGHPDHDATSFAVHAAARQCASHPRIIEFTSYHRNGDAMISGCFLPSIGSKVRTLHLSPDQRRRKRRMFACFSSQQDMLKLFRDDVERFRLAPDYDFTLPPHPGPLHYEGCDWGMTGERWRSLAAGALEELCALRS